MKVKLKDIAEKANTSITSVSLVLNNKPCRISDEKKALIKQIAKDNNYTPNINARSLITKETKTLGLIIPDIENIFFSKLTKTIETYCRQFGYALIIVNSNDEYKEDLHLLDLLLARGIDGLFITVSNSAYNHKEEVCSKLKSLTIPYIMIDRVFDELDCNQVYFDNVKGSYMATKYLIENGHTMISCITNSIYSKNTVSRFEGYKKAMKEHGLKIKDEYIIQGDYRIQSGYNTGDMVMSNNTTAVFVTNDMMALGLLKRLSEKDIKIPEDLSIVSYDNLLNDFIIGIDITSIDQNISNLGKVACDLMLSLIKNEETEIKKICLDPQLIIKRSVKNFNTLGQGR